MELIVLVKMASHVEKAAGRERAEKGGEIWGERKGGEGERTQGERWRERE